MKDHHNHKQPRDSQVPCVCGHGQDSHDEHGCRKCARINMLCLRYWSQEDFALWGEKHLELTDEPETVEIGG